MSSPLRTSEIEPSTAAGWSPAQEASLNAPTVSAASLLAFLDQTMAHLEVCRDTLRALVSAAAQHPPAGHGGMVEVRLEKPWTSEQVGEHFGVTPETINAWCIEGRFPNAQSLKKAGWRIPPSDIRALNMPVRTRGQMRRVR